MRKGFCAVFLCLLVVFSFVLPASAISSDGLMPANVTINGQPLSVSAYIVNGRTMVPMRAIFEMLDCTVAWDSATKSVTAVQGTSVIKLQIDSSVATVNGTNVTLDVPATVIDGKTYVPLRFVAESLGCTVDWDGGSMTAIIKAAGYTGTQVIHEGTINPEGETWSAGTIHIVQGDFYVQGDDSPVLTIEAGAIIRFEQGSDIIVGMNAPGGLSVEGTAQEPVVFTSHSSGPQPGIWAGIKFYDQTIRGKADIEYARVEYAGGNSWNSSAVFAESSNNPIDIELKNVVITNSENAGLYLNRYARLSDGSGNLTISGTITTGSDGGFPIIASAYGSNNLPGGAYQNNAVNAVLLTGDSMNVTTNTTWNNLGIPYQLNSDLSIGANSNPKLTILGGSTVKISEGCGIYVGRDGSGSLETKGTASDFIEFSPLNDLSGGWTGIVIGEYSSKCSINYSGIRKAVIGIEIYKEYGKFTDHLAVTDCSQYGVYHHAESGTPVYDMMCTFSGNAVNEGWNN